MSLRDLAETLSQDELRELADAIQTNDVAATLEADLEDALADTSMGERQAAFEENAAILDLLRALAVEFRFPEERPGDDEPDEPEFVIEEAEDDGPAGPSQAPRPETGAEGRAGRPTSRPGTGRRPGVEPGEEIIRDTSRKSGESIRRDIGFEMKFMDLMRDLGRCRQFDCQNRDLYFRLTESEQRRFFDFTPEGALQWLVRRREVTPSQLAARGFPSDVIP